MNTPTMNTPMPYPTPVDHRRRGLLHHFIAFAIIVPLLAALDWFTATPHWIHWVQWVVLGWGLGLVLHMVLALRR